MRHGVETGYGHDHQLILRSLLPGLLARLVTCG